MPHCQKSIVWNQNYLTANLSCCLVKFIEVPSGRQLYIYYSRNWLVNSVWKDLLNLHFHSPRLQIPAASFYVDVHALSFLQCANITAIQSYAECTCKASLSTAKKKQILGLFCPDSADSASTLYMPRVLTQLTRQSLFFCR